MDGVFDEKGECFQREFSRFDLADVLFNRASVDPP